MRAAGSQGKRDGQAGREHPRKRDHDQMDLSPIVNMYIKEGEGMDRVPDAADIQSLHEIDEDK
jgi:hypothetical protein